MSNFDAKPLGNYRITQRNNPHSSNKNNQTNTLISLTDTDPKPMDTNSTNAENRNITDGQRQALDKRRKWKIFSKVS